MAKTSNKLLSLTKNMVNSFYQKFSTCLATHRTFLSVCYCFVALFTQLTVEDSTNNSKYTIYMYGRKSADNYGYSPLTITATEIYIS